MSEMKKRRAILMLAGVSLILTGCSRAQINYQLAESIGTVGKYSNNEPVESPKMEAERLASEAASEAEADLQKELDHAQTLAASYDYDSAIKYLKTIDTVDETANLRVEAAISDYEALKTSLTPYTGSIPHLCFPILIQDGKMAFDGDDMSSTYRNLYLTTSEFTAILESLYDNNYIVVGMHDIAGIETNENGLTAMTRKTLELPADKKPIILSQDNVDFSSVKNGDGIATKLLVEDGEVKAQYTDDGGHNKVGAFEFIPILNDFIEEHPDFSYMGAHGTISVSGESGIFGYDTETDAAAVKEIADILRKDGWDIACAGYTHGHMDGMDMNALSKEIGSWQQEVQPLVGSTDILFYPYGGEVANPSDQLDYLISQGLVYLCGLWGSEDYMDVQDTYLRQTRRFVDGYSLTNAPDYFTQFFQASAVTDTYR